ncbi:MAG: response regulator transcription factor [Cyanobacteria bacterium J06639_1]
MSEKIRVVLVEDHALTRVGLRAALQNSGCIEVAGEAEDGRAGLQTILDRQPDVAIVDIGLPKMDGIELTQQLRQSQQEAGVQPTKVLILTMHDDEEAVLAAFAAGADSYSIKNVDVDRLVEAIQLTYEDESWIDPAIARVVLRQARRKKGSSPTATVETPASSASELESSPVAVVAPPEDEDEASNSEGESMQIAAVEPEFRQLIETTPLTQRELEVLEQIVAGCSNAAIAEKLFITVGTVKTHVRSIMNKLCADDRTQAAVRALRSGLVK